MGELIVRICEDFASDPTAPSLVLSRVDGKGFYGSIVRYTEPMAQGKVRVCSCFGADLKGVLIALTEAYNER